MLTRILEFFGSRRQRGAQAYQASEFTFVGEQDGPVEQQLKAKWTPVLRECGVARAYLAQVQFPGKTGPSVVLAMSRGVRPESGIVAALVPVFKSIMAGDEFVDMMFLNSEQERNVSSVCRSFLHAA